MSEDDQKWLEPKQTNPEDGLRDRRISPPNEMVKERSMVTTLPVLQDQAKVGGGVPEYVGMVSPNKEGMAETGQSQTRATVQTGVSGNSECVENITAVKMTTGYVTVKGVNLVEVQRLRKISDSQTTSKKKNTPKRDRKNITTTTPSSGNIKNYFVRKTPGISGTVVERSDPGEGSKKTTDIGDEEVKRKSVVRQADNVVRNNECAGGVRKKTFSSLDMRKKKSVKENIKMFEGLLEDNECVIGGGWCGTHHVRLVRSVTEKKMSCTGENGVIKWLRGEAVISACPYKTDRQCNEISEATGLAPSGFEGANGNKRFCEERGSNQLTASRIEREKH